MWCSSTKHCSWSHELGGVAGKLGVSCIAFVSSCAQMHLLACRPCDGSHMLAWLLVSVVTVLSSFSFLVTFCYIGVIVCLFTCEWHTVNEKQKYVKLSSVELQLATWASMAAHLQQYTAFWQECIEPHAVLKYICHLRHCRLENAYTC